ncbi:hypothetical protein V6L77_25830 [Pannonibacter sp. Pt2-lr]
MQREADQDRQQHGRRAVMLRQEGGGERDQHGDGKAWETQAHARCKRSLSVFYGRKGLIWSGHGVNLQDLAQRDAPDWPVPVLRAVV